MPLIPEKLVKQLDEASVAVKQMSETLTRMEKVLQQMLDKLDESE